MDEASDRGDRQVIYLAGPEVFLSNAAELGELKKEICRRHGFGARFPLDQAPQGSGEDKAALAMEIFDICIHMMRSSDLLIANLTPFTRHSMDVGTTVEIGYMYSSGKPVFAYTNVVESYHQRASLSGPNRGAEIIEDYDLVDNLMCEGPVHRSGGTVIRNATSPDRLFRSMDGFEACVRQARVARDMAAPAAGRQDTRGR